MSPALASLLATDMPPRLARRPRDARGFPIPATALITPDGTPDFRVTDIERWIRLVEGRCCALCAEPLEAELAFIGGPVSQKSRFFTDPAMHRECAEYALRVCPYLALPRAKHGTVAPIEGVELSVHDIAMDTRPEKFFLGITQGFQVALVGDSYVVWADPWQEVVWQAAAP